MTTHNKASAKDKVLAWVRSKNPQTMELEFGCKVLTDDGVMSFVNEMVDYPDGKVGTRFLGKNGRTRFFGEVSSWEIEGGEYSDFKILGSDMGLQELLIALGSAGHSYGSIFANQELWVRLDLYKNLHQQSDEFYEAILPLIPHD